MIEPVIAGTITVALLIYIGWLLRRVVAVAKTTSGR